MNRLIIGEINVNGIRNKIENLSVMAMGNIDILVIIESKLDSSFTSAQFLIGGFSPPFRLDRDKHGGGVMVYIREDIPSRELKLHSFSPNVEGIFVEINLRSKRWLLFAGYNNHKVNISSYLDQLGKGLDIYMGRYEDLLIVGDLNSVH